MPKRLPLPLPRRMARCAAWERCQPRGVDSQAGEESWDLRSTLNACYEAGPTGYVLYWQLAELGVACEVIAPTLAPMKAGDRVKTDRRDAEAAGAQLPVRDLTAVWVGRGVGVAAHLVRAREAAKQDQLRARHRLGKFLLRTGRGRRWG